MAAVRICPPNEDTDTEVGALVRDCNGNFLLGYRSIPYRSPCWTIPFSFLRRRESFEQASLRCVAGATGMCRNTHAAVFAVLHHIGDEDNSILIGTIVDCIGDQQPVTRSPFQAWRWCNPSHVPAPLHPKVRVLIGLLNGHRPVETWRAYSALARHR